MRDEAPGGAGRSHFDRLDAWLREREPLLITLLCLVQLTLCVWLSASLGVWVDEAYSLETSSRSPVAAIRRALSFELQPPLYFLVLSLWTKLHGSYFFARLLSVLCVVLATPIAARISRRLLPSRSGLWAAAALAIAPITLWAATEARLYALLILLSFVLFDSFLTGFVADERRRSRVVHVIAAVAGLYTQYYLGFILVANFVGLVAFRRWKAARAYLASMAVVGVAILPLLLVVVDHVSSHVATVTEPGGWLSGLKYLLVRSEDFALIGSATHGSGVATWVVRLAFAALTAAAFITLLRGRRWRWSDGTTGLAWIGVLGAASCLCFVFVYHLVTRDLLLRRHLVVLYPTLFAFPFLVGQVALRGRLLPVVCVAVLGLSVVGSYRDFRTVSKPGDLLRIADYITAHEAREAPIALFPSELELAIRHHLDGARLVPLPRAASVETFDMQSFVIDDPVALAEKISALAGEHDILWLVFRENRYLSVILEIGPVAEAIEQRYVLDHERKFNGGGHVRLYRRAGNGPRGE